MVGKWPLLGGREVERVLHCLPCRPICVELVSSSPRLTIHKLAFHTQIVRNFLLGVELSVELASSSHDVVIQFC